MQKNYASLLTEKYKHRQHQATTHINYLHNHLHIMLKQITKNLLRKTKFFIFLLFFFYRFYLLRNLFSVNYIFLKFSMHIHLF